ncbi:MAG: 16S rRNA (uracil(1498)-N(3))-methyltransferase [Cyanobacteriota bacterium]|nr:16S rRNA (uracil(1498)-N(3))-methyltransferase [Cyanobacteriota bacterium]
MAKEQRRLLIGPGRLSDAAVRASAGPHLTLDNAETHYLQRVLRLRSGDRFAVVNGVGQLWQAVFEPPHARLLTELAQPAQAQPAPSPELLLAVALPRRDGELLLRMATELGIDRLQPLIAERSVVERWNHQRAAVIVREAVEQCERLWAPQLDEPAPAGDWLSQPRGLRLLATTRRQQAPLLGEALRQAQGTHTTHGPSIGVAIGPEGGWSPAEEKQALSLGWQPVSLGPTILRTSTAAVAAAAALCSWRG